MRLFCVDQTYCCHDISKKVFLPTLKPVHRIFDHFGGCFALIGHIVAKVLEKTLLCRILNWFYGIRQFFFSTLGACFASIRRTIAKFENGFAAFSVSFFEQFDGSFASSGGTVAKIRAKTYFPDFEIKFSAMPIFLSTVVVVLHRSDVPLPRYVRKRSFANFETAFMAFVVLF